LAAISNGLFGKKWKRLDGSGNAENVWALHKALGRCEFRHEVWGLGGESRTAATDRGTFPFGQCRHYHVRLARCGQLVPC